MAATIKDIARLAGVSPATVSRVLANKTAFYGPATAEKVQAAALKLGYRKNTAAAELVTQHSNVIAVVVNSVKTNFSSQIITGIQDTAVAHGLNVIIVYAGITDPEAQRKALLTVIERPVMGILLLSLNLTPENLQLLQGAQTPYCFLSIAFDDGDLPSIASDDWQVGYQATQTLLKAGHRKIGLAAVDSDSHTGRFRLAGYESALRDAGVTPQTDWVQPGVYSYEAGREAMSAYGVASGLTGVVAGSDMAAIGVLNQARDLGLAVPTDLSIVSIDGTEMCELVQPQLTSVSQNFYDMGAAGVRQLLAPGKQLQQVTPIQVVDRQTVRVL